MRRTHGSSTLFRVAVASLAVGALVALGAGCGGGGGDDDNGYDRNALLADLADHVILPTYTDLATRAETLRAGVQTLCSTTNAANLQSARQLWREVRAPLKRAEAFQLGPIEDRRIATAIDFWPVRPDSIEDGISGASAYSAAYIGGLGTSSKGLPAIEFLLFGDNSTDSAVLSSLAAQGGRRCGYILALATEVAAKTQEVRTAWDPAGENYRAQFAEAGRSSTAFVTAQAAVDRVINQTLFLTEAMADNRLGHPLGRRAGGTPQPQLAESRFSDNSLDDLKNNLAGLENLYRGGYGTSGLGLAAVVGDRNATLDSQIAAALTQSRQTYDAIAPTLLRAIFDSPASVEAAFAQTKSLQRLVRVDLTTLLGVVVTFNGNDGD